MFIKVSVRGGGTQLVNLLHIERVRALTPLPAAKENDAKSCLHLSSGSPNFVEVTDSISEIEEKLNKAMDIELK